MERSLKVTRLRIDKAALLQVDLPERTFFLGAAHLVNELNALHRLLIWSANGLSGSEPQHKAQLALSMRLLRILGATLWEGWQMLEKTFFKSKVSAGYEPELVEASRIDLQELKRYFGRRSLLRTVRNEFGFHYAPELLEEALNKLGTGETLDLYLADANNLYFFAEMLANMAMTDAVNEDDLEKGFERIMKEIVEVSGWLLGFLDGALAVFLGRHSRAVIDVKGRQDFELQELPDFDQVTIPWYSVAEEAREV